MKVGTVIARVLLGLIFVVFGSNAFLHFIPMPPLPKGVTGEYLHAFFESGYVYVIGGLQVIGGLLLLIGRFVPLGLTILGAIIVNIWIFHDSAVSNQDRLLIAGQFHLPICAVAARSPKLLSPVEAYHRKIISQK